MMVCSPTCIGSGAAEMVDVRKGQSRTLHGLTKSVDEGKTANEEPDGDQQRNVGDSATNQINGPACRRGRSTHSA